MAAGRVKFEAAGTGDVGRHGRRRQDQSTGHAHEMGHMFGLDDEYPGPGGLYAPGKTTEHTDFADKAGFKGRPARSLGRHHGLGHERMTRTTTSRSSTP